MKSFQHFVAFLRLGRTAGCLLALIVGLTGCGHKEGEHVTDDGHGHEEEPPSGASYQAGKGVMLTDETRKILKVEVASVTEQPLPNQVALTIQVFSEKHHHLVDSDDHRGCDVQGAGFLATNIAAIVKAGQSVQLLKDTNSLLPGVVLGVQKALALGEAEVVVGVSNAATALKPGEFIPVRINVPREHAVVVIPQAALLQTAEGSFVYTLNGDAYSRRAVKAGAQADGVVEITDGLRAGEEVVTQHAQTLWLIELRATKGGGHSH